MLTIGMIGFGSELCRLVWIFHGGLPEPRWRKRFGRGCPPWPSERTEASSIILKYEVQTSGWTSR